MKLHNLQIDNFTLGYIVCALWSSLNPSDPDIEEPLDQKNSMHDISEPLLLRILGDTKKFQEENEALLLQAGDDSQNGHDFWLDREGHGAGFWDRGYGDIGDRLKGAAMAYGSGSDAFFEQEWNF